MTQLPAADSAPAFCTGCGQSSASCPGCGRDFDPPRYCSACGRWMGVTVTPSGWTARCKEHGEQHSA